LEAAIDTGQPTALPGRSLDFAAGSGDMKLRAIPIVRFLKEIPWTI
jgi:hypothetical protein